MKLESDAAQGDTPEASYLVCDNDPNLQYEILNINHVTHIAILMGRFTKFEMGNFTEEWLGKHGYAIVLAHDRPACVDHDAAQSVPCVVVAAHRVCSGNTTMN